MSLDSIRLFAISKLAWIRQQQKKMRAQERESAREYIERESLYVWGTRYLLNVIERNQAPSVELKHGRLLLSVRPGCPLAKRQTIVEQWYRDQVRLALPALIARWTPIVGVTVRRVFVQRIK